MKTLTKIALICSLSIAAIAQSNSKNIEPSYTIEEYVVAYDSQLSKNEILPALMISVPSQNSKNVKFTLAYANEFFKDIRSNQKSHKIENFYFGLQYRF